MNGKQNCQCRTCLKDVECKHTGLPMLMVTFTVCEICGNKRCPHAENHEFMCTGSNKPGQVGVVATGEDEQMVIDAKIMNELFAHRSPCYKDDDIFNFQEEIGELKELLSTSRCANERLEKENARLNQVIDGLDKTMDSMTQQIRLLENKVDDKENEIKSLEEVNEDLKAFIAIVG